VQSERLSCPLGIDRIRNLRSDADNDTGHVRIRRHRRDERVFLERVVHDCANATEDGLEDLQTERRLALGGWNEYGLA
jgi:hypothetical protein